MARLTLARLKTRWNLEEIDDLEVARLARATAVLLGQTFLQACGHAQRRLLAHRLEGRAALIPL